MICETFKDQPYDYRADIWSLGITLIELAQMEPPFHDIPPMRVLIKIQKSDPPTLDRPAAWSKLFNRFLKRCLVKDPNQRASAKELQQVDHGSRKNVFFLRIFLDQNLWGLIVLLCYLYFTYSPSNDKSFAFGRNR